MVFANFALPFSALLPAGSDASNGIATYNASKNRDGEVVQQAGASGSFLPAHNLGWNVSQGYSHENGHQGSVGVSYRGSDGEGNAGYSYSSNYRQINYGLNGGIYLQRHGVTLGQYPGDVNVLIEAPGAPDLPIENAAGASTNLWGYAVVSIGSPYRENTVSIDPGGLDSRTELKGSTSQQFVPTKGALMKARFNAVQGLRGLLTLRHNGMPLPFGTMVSTENSSGIVGDDGEVYLAGLGLQGVVTAQWGNDTNNHCVAKYLIPEKSKSDSLVYTESVCR